MMFCWDTKCERTDIIKHYVHANNEVYSNSGHDGGGLILSMGLYMKYKQSSGHHGRLTEKFGLCHGLNCDLQIEENWTVSSASVIKSSKMACGVHDKKLDPGNSFLYILLLQHTEHLTLTNNSLLCSSFCFLCGCLHLSKTILPSHAKLAVPKRTVWKPDSLSGLMLLLVLADAQEKINMAIYSLSEPSSVPSLHKYCSCQGKS